MSKKVDSKHIRAIRAKLPGVHKVKSFSEAFSQITDALVRQHFDVHAKLVKKR